MDLQQLQNAAKRDPISYKDDCVLQYKHFKNELEIFKLKPNTHSKEFIEQINFFSHIAPVYIQLKASGKGDDKSLEGMEEFPKVLYDLAEQKHSLFHSDVRKCIVKALFLLRNRSIYTAIGLLPLLFKLFRCHDKQLRKQIFDFIIQDIRNINKKHKDNKLNKTLQNYMYTMIQDENVIAARYSLSVLIDLYRYKIWNDAKTVNVISTACFIRDSKMLTAALKFFLKASGKSSEDDSDDEEAEKDGDKIRQAREAYQKYSASHVKKTKKRQTKVKKALQQMAKLSKKNNDDTETKTFNFPAIELIHDPQSFIEKLFGLLKHSLEKFEIRLMIMNLISRVIYTHKLLLINFYPFLQRYMQPHQNLVTYVLAIAAQAVHEQIPDDVIFPMLKTIANNFVNDRSSPETITIGLNTIREIARRAPFSMEADNGDLLRDLVQYRTYKNKSVAMAAKSILTLYRATNQNLLSKKDRGKRLTIAKPVRFGEQQPAESIDGIELLEEYERKKAAGEEVEEIEEGWRDDSDSDSEGEWVNVSSDDEGGNEDEDEESDDDKESKGKEEASDSDIEEREAAEGEWDDIWESDDFSEDEEENDDEDSNEEEEEEEEEDEDEDEDEESEHEEASTSKQSRKRSASEQSQEPKKKQKQESSDSSESAVVEQPKKEPTEEEKKLRLDALRILSPEDFERIAYLKLKAQVDPKKNISSSDKISPEMLEAGIKRKKMSKEERQAAVAAGRDGREKFGRRKKEAGSLTNREKSKKVIFNMKKHSRKFRERKKLSLHDKKRQLSKHLDKTKAYSHKR